MEVRLLNDSDIPRPFTIQFAHPTLFCIALETGLVLFFFFLFSFFDVSLCCIWGLRPKRPSTAPLAPPLLPRQCIAKSSKGHVLYRVFPCVQPSKEEKGWRAAKRKKKRKRKKGRVRPANQTSKENNVKERTSFKTKS